MDLQAVRARINEIDKSLDELFDERLKCSKKVAEVKLATNDEVFKPAREKEIYARYSDDVVGKNHKSYVRKIIQLSRKYQYSQFIEKNVVDEAFYTWLDDKSVLKKGGVLKLKLNMDASGNNGLDIKNMLEIAADTSLELVDVKADIENSKAELIFNVSQDDESKCEAFLISYMLYKETIK